jgi:hypothetical protein
MSSDGPKALSDIEVDRNNLYREEVYTDLKIASIRVLTPVTADGATDTRRSVLFTGETQLMSQMGPVPVHAPIDAANLDEAIGKFPAAVNAAVERLMEEAREMQRREASRIVVPGQMPPPGKITLG